MDFNQILEKYRTESESKRELGTRFEELMKRYLLTDPTYSPLLDWVCLWSDFYARKDFGNQDTGIDLVAKTKDGDYWAIQCKCYAEGHQVTKSDMDTFLSTSGKMFTDDKGWKVSFSNRIVFATTDSWSSHAIDVQEGQMIPVSLIGLDILSQSPVDWDELENGTFGSSARKAKYSLREHQKTAVANATEHYSKNDRGSMIMACGTGKTFTSLKVAESLVTRQGACILFLAPSIALVGQTLREWMANTEVGMKPICVCSDVNVSKKRIEDDVGDRVERLGMPATTNSDKIISYRSRSELTVVFSTYQSLDAVIAAQSKGFPDFDLIICDEAHRTTGAIISGVDESTFTKVHSNDNVRGKKRLYMTATPRLYGEKGKEDAAKASVVLCSMDDESIYGKEFYNISFGKAVEEGLLSDYKVMILSLRNSDIPEFVKNHNLGGNKEIDADMNSLIWGCLNAFVKNMAYDKTLKNTDPGNMKSVVSFCRTISRSKALAERFRELSAMPTSPIRLDMKHIDGSMNSMKRDELMTWLKTDSEETRVLSNVRCLCEGVDVPALDAVVFMDSKGSLVDVVQSVGRVMRKAEGKKYGYIVIPILIPGDEDPESALNDNERYKVVWKVLRALRSHDERLDAEINTFQYRKSNTGGHIHMGRLHVEREGEGDWMDEGEYAAFASGRYTLDDFGGALFARLVLKVGDREYIENWARDVAKVMPVLMERLTQICEHEEHGYKQYKPAFTRYLKGLRACVNDNVSEKDAINMLAQQIVTKPIFEKLFGGDGFAMQNSVSDTINKMLDDIDEKNGLKDVDQMLAGFYTSVENTLSKIDTVEGRQKVITSLYEKFFKNAFPKDQAINGVVYTPLEIVDFILRSAADILKNEFDLDINDENVNILDPFTGTGTFIARLMETGIITKANLERKYRNELFANEITLLAYYIATVNIENTYARITGSETYVPFDNILLTDTFNIEEICRHGGKYSQSDFSGEEYFVRNKSAIKKENDTQITLVVGNPPYGGRQKSTGDDAKKRKYREGIDSRIEESYLKDSLFSEKKGNVNSVYDNYVRAFRWATDRIGDNDGVIAFVTPSGWLTGSAFEGFRKTVENEFSKIFIFDLRGNKGTTDEMRRIEGRNVFEYSSDRGGCTVGVAVTVLVKRKSGTGKAKIYYKDIADFGDRLKGFEKRNWLKQSESFYSLLNKKQLEILESKPNGDWLIERNEIFNTLIPIAGDTHKKFNKHCENTIFTGYSLGLATHRDSWSYNYCKTAVLKNMSNMIEEYNNQLKLETQIFDAKKICWGNLTKKFNERSTITFDPNKLDKSAYRPFTTMWLYDGIGGIDAPYNIMKLFPNSAIDNRLICVAGVGDKADFSCLMTDRMTDLHIVGSGQCFPLYWYEDNSEIRRKNKISTLFDDDKNDLVRRDGISDYIFNTARKKYGQDITKEDIFYYVYGYLHSPEYREAFSDDLKLSLPRIDLVESKEDFLAFSKAGRELAELHLNYENLDPPEPVRIRGEVNIKEVLEREDICKVRKMRLYPEERKVVYNEYITVENIPEEAFQYTVNGRSAIGWVVDQYQYSVDKASGIVNDPNEYAGGTYVLKLLLSVITVSVKTMEIVGKLPKLHFDGTNEEP